MKKHVKIILMALIAVLPTSLMFAQEWSKEQSEIWKVVEDNWKNWKSGDATKVAALMHEKYQTWSDEAPLPMGKSSMMAWYNEMKDMMKVEMYSIEPARIAVTKSAAVVDYYYYFNLTYTMNGKTDSKEMKGKAVEFYVKEGDKWLLLGDMMIHNQDGEDEDD